MPMGAENSHIVIVEDDPPVGRALARLLRSAGFHTTLCGSAEDFLALQRDLTPSCLLLDVHLPRLNGLDLMRALDRLEGRVPIVFMTGDVDLVSTIQTWQAGWQCLRKPVDEIALLSAISAAMQMQIRLGLE